MRKAKALRVQDSHRRSRHCPCVSAVGLWSFFQLHGARFPLLISEEPSSAHGWSSLSYVDEAAQEEPSSAHGWSSLSHIDEAAQEVGCRWSLPCSYLRSYWAQLWACAGDTVCISAVNTVFSLAHCPCSPNIPCHALLSLFQQKFPW